MSCMIFDHRQMVNLEQSLQKEFLRSNRAGAFASSTLVYCNTRKHHGLLVCPIEGLNGENHVLLSALDETILLEGHEFHLGIHKYPLVYHPLGHKYIESVGVDPGPYVVYKVGTVLLKKEAILSEEIDQLLIRYTLVDSAHPITIRFQPYLAFRSIHSLTHENPEADRSYMPVGRGAAFRMYDKYPHLHLQFSKDNKYSHEPKWFQKLEYIEEQVAGEDFQEDLYVPGMFELNLKKGDSVIVSAATAEQKPSDFSKQFAAEVKKRIPRTTYDNCLINAAEQFIKHRGARYEVVAGYPYFGTNGRDALISLPGLTLYRANDEKNFKAVLDTISADLDEKPVFSAFHYDGTESADTPLWYIWTIQQYARYKNSFAGLWKTYGLRIRKILEAYISGAHPHIAMRSNKLIYAFKNDTPLTWMDIVLDGEVMNHRGGYAVEVNALWYNALRFAATLASKARAKEEADAWNAIADEIPEAFVQTFWGPKRRYLADFVNDFGTDWAIRPNMVFAASLPYSPLDTDKKNAVLDTVRLHLVTKKGLRSISPRNPQYVGMPSLHRREARRGYHQGNIFPWLFGHYIEGMFALRGKIALHDAEAFYHEFEKEMTRKGMGAVSEYFHGNPPHEGRGAISQAWNTAELLRVRHLIDKYKNQ